MSDKKPPSEKKKKSYASSTGVPNPRVDQLTWRQKMKPGRIKFDDDMKELYLLNLADHGQKVLASKALGISHTTYQTHVKNDPEFAKRVTEVIRARGASMVQQIEKEALDGHEEKRYDKSGNISSTIIRYESNLRGMILKRHDSEYRDKHDINVNHTGGVLVVPSGQTSEEWTGKADELKQKMLAENFIEAEIISSEISDD